MGDVERVMERVHRLLAIANDPAASDNEQRIALEQAQRLMNKHAIEEWQLEEDHDDVEIIERRIRLETNPCNRYMAQLANIVAHGNRCRAAYECRRAGNGRDVVSTVWIYGARVDVDKTESIWTAMETSRAAMWRERVDRWVETHVTFISDKPKLSKATRPSQAAYRHGRRDGARQAIGLKETGQAGNWTLEK